MSRNILLGALVLGLFAGGANAQVPESRSPAAIVGSETAAMIPPWLWPWVADQAMELGKDYVWPWLRDKLKHVGTDGPSPVVKGPVPSNPPPTAPNSGQPPSPEPTPKPAPPKDDSKKDKIKYEIEIPILGGDESVEVKTEIKYNSKRSSGTKGSAGTNKGRWGTVKGKSAGCP